MESPESSRKRLIGKQPLPPKAAAQVSPKTLREAKRSRTPKRVPDKDPKDRGDKVKIVSHPKTTPKVCGAYREGASDKPIWVL